MKIRSEVSVIVDGTESQLAAREDSPIPGGIAYWNAAAQRFDTRKLILDTDLAYYVDPVLGNDSNTGLTAETPFKTVTKAIEILSLTQIVNGNVSIVAAPGFYDEIVTIPAGFLGKGTISLLGAADILDAGSYFIKGIYNKLYSGSGITTVIKGFKVFEYSGRLTQNDCITFEYTHSQLANLQSSILFSPAFDPAQYSYSANTSETSIMIVPTLNDQNSTITINGSPAQSGQSQIISLDQGTNIITIEIIPVFGLSSQYVLTVEKDSL